MDKRRRLFEVMSPKLALMANYTFYQTFSCVADSQKTPS